MNPSQTRAKSQPISTSRHLHSGYILAPFKSLFTSMLCNIHYVTFHLLSTIHSLDILQKQSKIGTVCVENKRPSLVHWNSA